MQSDPRMSCPLCGDPGFTRFNLPLHIVTHHGASWEESQVFTRNTLRFARSLLANVTGPQPKYPMVAHVGAGYGATTPIVYRARYVRWRLTGRQIMGLLMFIIADRNAGRLSADVAEDGIRRCVEALRKLGARKVIDDVMKRHGGKGGGNV